jgi:hypothetical protein
VTSVDTAKSDDLLPRIVIDPLRAGLQVAGGSLMSLAFAFAVTSHSNAGLWVWMASSAMSMLVVALRGYPTPLGGFVSFLARAFGALVWGAAFTAAIVMLVLVKIDSLPESVGWRVVLAVSGAALVAIGIWPRRRVATAPAKASPASRDVASACLVVALVAVATAAIASHADWIPMTWRLARRAPDAVALAMGGAIGFSLIVFVVSVIWIVQRRTARPWTLALLPAIVLTAIGLAVERTVMRPALAAADGVTQAFDERVGDLADAIVVAWPAWAVMLLLAAAVLAGSALAIGVRARNHFGRGAGPRPLAAFIVGIVLVVVIPFLTHALFSRSVGDARLQSTWVALLPSTIGVAAIFLASGSSGAPGDAIIAALFAMLSVIAIAFGGAVGVLWVFGSEYVGPAEQARIAASMSAEQRRIILVTLIAIVPILAALIIALPPRRMRRGVERAAPIFGAAVVTLWLALAALQLSTRAATGALATLWTRQLPAGAMLARGDGDPCDGLVVPEAIFIGPTAITRAGASIGATSLLDTEEGCAAFVLDLDRAPKPSTELRLAFDPQIAYGRVECLGRALASSALRDAKTSRVVRRRPRCAVQAMTTRAGVDEVPFPQCTTLHLAGEECVAPRSDMAAIATASTLFLAQYGSVVPYPLGAEVIGEPSAVGSPDALLLAATVDAPFAALVSLPMRMRQYGSSAGYPGRETWLVPSDLPAPSTLAPLRADPTENASVVVSSRSGALDATAVRETLASATERFRTCQTFGSGPAAARSGEVAFRLLVGDGGAVKRVWIDRTIGGPLVGACVSRVLSELRFAPPSEPAVVFATLGVRIVRASITVALTDTDGTTSREHAALAALRVLAEGPLRSCYEADLRRDPHLGGVVRMRVQVSRASKITFAFADKSFDDKVASCALDVIRKMTMPPVATGDYELRFALKMAPPP